MHLILIGFMGAGKSSVGKMLGACLELPLIDTDDRIEEIAGMPVVEIFRTGGEEAFRDLESGVIRGLSGEAPGVVSCGGGAVLLPENRSALRSLGRVFYLQATPEEIAERLKEDTERPLLNGVRRKRERIEEMLEQRESYYRETADYVIRTGGRGLSEVVEEIGEIWRGSR